MKMGNGIKMEFDDDWLEKYQIEHVVISPIVQTTGAVVASLNKEDIFNVMIFNLQFNENSSNYSITKEIASFSFLSDEEKDEFLQYLPEMSAMDLIFYLIQNPHQPIIIKSAVWRFCFYKFGSIRSILSSISSSAATRFVKSVIIIFLLYKSSSITMFKIPKTFALVDAISSLRTKSTIYFTLHEAIQIFYLIDSLHFCYEQSQHIRVKNVLPCPFHEHFHQSQQI
jgi:hypothetical protein